MQKKKCDEALSGFETLKKDYDLANQAIDSVEQPLQQAISELEGVTDLETSLKDIETALTEVENMLKQEENQVSSDGSSGVPPPPPPSSRFRNAANNVRNVNRFADQSGAVSYTHLRAHET